MKAFLNGTGPRCYPIPASHRQLKTKPSHTPKIKIKSHFEKKYSSLDHSGNLRAFLLATVLGVTQHDPLSNIMATITSSLVYSRVVSSTGSLAAQ